MATGLESMAIFSHIAHQGDKLLIEQATRMSLPVVSYLDCNAHQADSKRKIYVNTPVLCVVPARHTRRYKVGGTLAPAAAVVLWGLVDVQ